MGAFFMFLIGGIVCYFLIIKETIKTEMSNLAYYNKNYQIALDHNKPVMKIGYENGVLYGQQICNGRKVYKWKNKEGLEWWFYAKTNRPIVYEEDKRIQESLDKNLSIAINNNKRWCVVENYWDDSVINLDGNKRVLNTYLDDFGDNPLNQKVYLKNMRPYQLYVLGKSNTGSYNIDQRQYLIRFGEPFYFNYKKQYCISDKKSVITWTVWYAITEDDYISLVASIDEANNKLITIWDLERLLVPIDMECIAYEKGVNNVDWSLDNCGIKKAFDCDGNFVKDLKN